MLEGWENGIVSLLIYLPFFYFVIKRQRKCRKKRPRALFIYEKGMGLFEGGHLIDGALNRGTTVNVQN